MCGLILLQEFHNWTAEDFDLKVQYALNLNTSLREFSTRIVTRYRALFRKENLASKVLERVTLKLVKILNISVKNQRLDSIHFFFNMAIWGRTKLMSDVRCKFLRKLKNTAPQIYADLPEGLCSFQQNWNYSGNVDTVLSLMQITKK